MSLRRSLRRLAAAQRPTRPPVTVSHKLGTVATVTAGTSTDGRATVTVTVGGDTIPAPYLLSYASPTVGDMVAVLLVNHSPLILGRVVGLPAF